MRPRQKLLYLLVDGAHARFVEWSQDKRDFVTVRRMDGEGRLNELRAEQRDEQPGRSFESASAGRHGVGRDDDVYRRAKEAFAQEVGRTLGEVLSERQIEGVVVAAPPPLLKTVRASLPAHTSVVGEIGKDLLKTPDHELAPWLGPFAGAGVR